MPGTEPVGADSAGRVLRSAREALGLSRREIAEALNLLESTVVAIEDDDRARQPEPVFLRGYVRNYARLLRLDPEPLVAALNSERRPVATPVKVPKPLASNKWLWPVAGALVASLLLLVTVFYLLGTTPQDAVSMDEKTVAQEPSAADGQGDYAGDSKAQEPPLSRDNNTPARLAPLPNDGPVDSAGTPASDAPVLVEIDTDGADSPPTGEAVEGVDKLVSLLSTDIDPVIDAVEVSAQGDAATTIKPRRLNRGTDRIRLDFVADCWVRVKDINGKMLFSDMGRAGGAIELLGTGPFDLLLGNAPGTTLQWNGVPIPLQPYMRNNVATLKVGDTPLAHADERPAPQ